MVNADINHIQQLLSERENSLSELDSNIKDPRTIKDRVYDDLAVLTAKGAGLCHIILGNYDMARKYFYQAFDLNTKLVELRTYKDPLDPFNYALVFERLQISILTLDKELMEKTTREFDLKISVLEWPRGGSRPFYCLIKAMAGIILNWDRITMEQIKEESKKMERKGGVDGRLGVIWAILDNNLESLKMHFKTVIRSQKQQYSGERMRGVLQTYISPDVMELLILAKIKSMDLKDFDPPLSDMGYINLYE